MGTSSVATVHGQSGGSARHVGAPGDVDGDGLADLLFGGSGYDSGRGYAEVWSGATSGLSSAATATLYGTAANDAFGYTVGGAGDVNSDGVKDFFVSAPTASASVGEVQIFLGVVAPPDTGDTGVVDTGDTGTVDTGLVDTGVVDTGDTGVVDTGGFFEPLLAMLDRAVEEGFLWSEHRRMLLVAGCPEEVLPAIRAYAPPEQRFWLKPDES